MDYIDYADLSEEEARGYLEGLRWPNGPVCLFCGNKNIARLNGQKHRKGVLKCRDCRKQFTVTVDTIFHGSHIPLRKWVRAFHLVCCSKKGISALQLQRMLGLRSYKSAWFLAHRIRHAMRQEPLKTKLNGVVEADETYVGARGKKGSKQGFGTTKTPVMALVQRGGPVRAFVIEKVTTKNLRPAILENVDPDSTLMTDELRAYRRIGREFRGGHYAVKHGAGEYSRRVGSLSVNCNAAESFFALLKRGLYGVFHHCSKQHLQKYVDEFSFRWDYRTVSDHARTEAALRAAPGKRLAFKNPIFR